MANAAAWITSAATRLVAAASAAGVRVERGPGVVARRGRGSVVKTLSWGAIGLAR
jgi:hypothetical protein